MDGPFQQARLDDQDPVARLESGRHRVPRHRKGLDHEGLQKQHGQRGQGDENGRLDQQSTPAALMPVRLGQRDRDLVRRLGPDTPQPVVQFFRQPDGGRRSGLAAPAVAGSGRFLRQPGGGRRGGFSRQPDSGLVSSLARQPDGRRSSFGSRCVAVI